MILVTPETVVRWHRAGFRLYWSWISRARKVVGRKPISREVRDLIFRMVAENPTWGLPHPRGVAQTGFRNLGKNRFSLGEAGDRNPNPARRWLAFLRNHRETIAAMDFFTVPTLTFGVLYCFFVIGHDRRKILHCNVTRQPNALWKEVRSNLTVSGSHSRTINSPRQQLDLSAVPIKLRWTV